MKKTNYIKTGTKVIIKSPFMFIKHIPTGIITTITLIPRYIITGFKYIFEKKPEKPENDILNNKFLSIVINTLCIITYFLSIFILSRWYVQNERTKNFAKSLNNDIINDNNNITNQYKDLTDSLSKNSNYKSNYDDNFINVNLNYYINKNKETVAWIQVNGTNINYPVVQHKDNSYYLTHDFYQHKTNVGWVFGDYRDNFESFSNNTIIYAHNLINRTMFGQLPYLLKKNWFSNKNKRYIKLSTKNTNSIWEIFSVYEIKPTTDYLQVNFYSTSAYQDFLDTISNRSKQKLNSNSNNTDKILTLSTCNDVGNNRIAVHAKLIKIENK